MERKLQKGSFRGDWGGVSGRLNGEWMEYERETKEKTHDHYFILQGPYLDREKVIQWGKNPANHKEQILK